MSTDLFRDMNAERACQLAYSMQWPGNPAGKFSVNDIFAEDAEIYCNNEKYSSGQALYDALKAKLAAVSNKKHEIKSLIISEAGLSWHATFSATKPDGSPMEAYVSTILYWTEVQGKRKVGHWSEIGGYTYERPCL